MRGQLALPAGTDLFGHLEPVAPVFDWKAAVSLGFPLFLVTLAAQNLPGLVVLQSAGYPPPANRLILSTGVASLLIAPFGGPGVNLAAITAAICTGPDAHPDVAKRWIVGVIYGGLYLVVALFAAPLAGLFIAMPPAVLAAVTGLALIAPLTGALHNMIMDVGSRVAAVLTFAGTASGLPLFGVGSAFWGLVVGFAAGIPSISLNRILLRSAQVIGVFWGAHMARDPMAGAEDMRHLMALYAAGHIRPKISERYSLERGGEAIARLASRGVSGKIVVEIKGSESRIDD
jgi:predicted benzoate:H+ symporter BenE